ncbi:glutamate--tRNA ligase [Desulfosarcina ovata subsp. sediminis]|uniref:Glutamate--tRNA ligase n=1 Tax=Desulfosarcina ovata subsp. sediminis TaxID=885957 RepID=A0A5K7ZKZ4_9BACT|nr:glutamate--tRNA ligase [Desulfosarcina ovata]BBO81716.1 glutamate--tRNA ligase [Desulfosarcina ovata subsp. sediminis]
METVRVRFPPSPTGYLHIGGARTALLNWLFARKHGGKLVLRIEDTDAERSTQASIDGILDGLTWLGLDWDEGPYFQTQFKADHALAAARLLESGKAYKCFCTRETLEAKREQALANKQAVGYDGTCRHLSASEVAAREADGMPSVIRFKVPAHTGKIGYDDRVLGRIERAYADIEDFVIVRSNGEPLYLLCNVVDDIRDRISHVIRGQDHMTNTVRQLLLYEALGARPPVFAHMPLTLDLKKRKISKRHHGEIVSVQFYRERGFLPWALCNFLVLLGWNPGTDQEIFSREELIQAFTLERIGRVNSVFNYRAGDPKFFTDPKLIAINETYLRSTAIETIGNLVKPELESAGLWHEDYAGARREWYLETLDLIRDRFHTLKDFATLGRAYFADDYAIDEKPLKKNLLKHPELKSWLPQLADRFAALDVFTLATTELTSRAFAEELGVKPGVLINGMRTVLTGQLAGPGMFDILMALGRETVVRRLNSADRRYF